MNNKRKRAKTLIIVEGVHEKNQLFWLISKCFPEMGITMDNIWVYGTNLYSLYECIINEYGAEWAKPGMADIFDIDLPYIISRKLNYNELCYKEDFTNILLVFDYERHDIKFSESKISNMQNYFTDPANMGKLYINYPMLESCQHLKKLPDTAYEDRRIPVTLQPGKKYKAIVREESIIADIIYFPGKLKKYLYKNYNDEDFCEKCADKILSIPEKTAIDNHILQILNTGSSKINIETQKNSILNCILKLGYLDKEQSFWTYLRKIFQQIIIHNICKANKIQNGNYYIDQKYYKKYFEKLDFSAILQIQNMESQKDNGYIWVLNTCVFIIAEYNFTLVTG